MTIQIVADTHALLWFLYDDSRLSENASRALESAEHNGGSIAISSVTLAEIVYLIEKQRIDPNAFDRVSAVLQDARATLVEVPFDLAIAKALRQIRREQVPELPDRMVAATALHLGVPVVSRDTKIRASSVITIW